MSTNFNVKIEINSLQDILKKRGLETKGEVQKFVDSEVLRQSDPYVPKLEGVLIESGQKATVIGSGKVKYKTPYAKRQYYEGRSPGTSERGALRGKPWFERMKNSHLQQILEGAKKKAGAK